MQLPPGKRTLTARRSAAMTLLEMVVVVAVLATAALLLLPALSGVHDGTMHIRCSNNLRQIGLSFKMWAEDNNDKFPMQVAVTNGGTMELVSNGYVFPHFQVMSNEIDDPVVLVCPQDKGRTAPTNFQTDLKDDHISYFVNVDADPTNPGAILMGDRNLALVSRWLKPGMNCLIKGSIVNWTDQIHTNCGNIALADGSVQRVNSEQLRQLLQTSGLATNRLILP